MARIPVAERPPGDLPEPHKSAWKSTLAALKELGTWQPELRGLLDEYIAALRLAAEHRKAAIDDGAFSFSEKTGRTYLHPGFASADRESRRALALADALGLTARARKALGAFAQGDDDDQDEPQDDFAALDAAVDLAERRQAKQAAAG